MNKEIWRGFKWEHFMEAGQDLGDSKIIGMKDG